MPSFSSLIKSFLPKKSNPTPGAPQSDDTPRPSLATASHPHITAPPKRSAALPLVISAPLPASSSASPPVTHTTTTATVTATSTAQQPRRLRSLRRSASRKEVRPARPESKVWDGSGGGELVRPSTAPASRSGSVGRRWGTLKRKAAPALPQEMGIGAGLGGSEVVLVERGNGNRAMQETRERGETRENSKQLATSSNASPTTPQPPRSTPTSAARAQYTPTPSPLAPSFTLSPPPQSAHSTTFASFSTASSPGSASTPSSPVPTLTLTPSQPSSPFSPTHASSSTTSPSLLTPPTPFPSFSQVQGGLMVPGSMHAPVLYPDEYGDEPETSFPDYLPRRENRNSKLSVLSWGKKIDVCS